MSDDDDAEEPVPVVLGGTPAGAADRVLKVVRINNSGNQRLTKYEIVKEDGQDVAYLTFEDF